ncbi:MAG: arylsulfatase [Bacteroidales bacterium]
MKNTLIKTLPLLGAGTVICQAGIMTSCSPESGKTSTPNIVIIITDDQGWGDLSLNGNTNLHTPNIDKLAHEGAQFSNFYVSPVCSPTRAELLSGRYHPRSGVFSTSTGGERMNLDETTIAEVFKEAGYATGAFGKWHNGMQYPYHPNGRGFDEFYGFCSGHWGDYYSPPLEHNGKIVQGEGYVPDDITGKAIDFIEKNKSNPFFLYIPQITPHTPAQVPDKWWDRFRDKEIEMLTDKRYTEDIQFTRAALAMCENIDWNIGRVMDKLSQSNLKDNTIIIYLSDNGPNSWRWNGGMKGRKGSTDEGGVRAPFIIRWPGQIEPGLRINEIAAVIDFLPTLADMAGIDYQTIHPLDGISLKPLLLEKDYEWKDRLIFSHWNNRVSVRSQEYRLGHEGMLFNIVEDPGQLKDISVNEPEIHDYLLAEVEKWKKDVLPGLDMERRPFTVGHPDFEYTQLPARDGQAHGNIVRSNRFPNSSFFTNWTSIDDKITWDIEVPADGWFDVEIYYTCPSKDTGSTFKLSFGNSNLTGKINEGHDPPLRGMENDRIERQESYVKDFKPLHIGKIFLEQGTGQMTLQATEMPGAQVMDFRLLMLKRIAEQPHGKSL